MSDATHAGRISELAFDACLGFFLGISVLAVTLRTTIRIKTRHKLYADDAFLFFGLICMCIATGLVYSTASVVYLEEAILFDPKHYTLPLNELPHLLESLKVVDVFVVFAWTAEFSVKFSLLLFFHALVKRLRPLTLHVKFVMVVTALVWAVLVCESFMLCPHFGLAGLTKCTPTNVPLTVGLTVLIVTLDIISDILILSIPIILLWKATMTFKQKMGVGAFLTVNVWLVIIALVRVSSFKRRNTFDLTWTLFFQFFEPNMAILAACFSAFRSLLINNSSGFHEHDNQHIEFRKRLFRKSPSGHQELDDLPSVPGPTLKGMRTLIWQNNKTKISTFHNNDTDLEPIPGHGMGEGLSKQNSNHRLNNIHVQHDWSVESTKAGSSRDRSSGRQFV